MRDFTNKVAVITGGASGIGFAVARALANQGAKLVLADIEGVVLADAVRLLQEGGGEVVGAVTDVAERASLEDLADLAWDRFGGANIVMHNAGVAVFGPIQEMTAQDWLWTMGVNLWGPIHGVEVFLPRMLASGAEGHMIFTASFAGLVPNRDLAPYNVAKAGVVALAESVRKDTRGTGVSASVLCPMRVASNIDFSARNRPGALGGASANRTYTDEERSALQGRTLDADTVAALVLSGVRDDRLYIHTHAEARAYFQTRAERILDAFGAAI